MDVQLPYNVKIEAFEGPLDLLLHLINRYEIDIYNIPVAQITEQYMAYIHAMQELELDIASEYLVMAATLLAIKSKMLLPAPEEEADGDMEFAEPDDPREELMQRLLEYKKFKEAARELKRREEERALLFTKPPSDLSAYAGEKKAAVPLDVNVYDMLGALSKLLRRKKLQKPVRTKITRQDISVEKRMAELLHELRQTKGRKNFYELFPSYDRSYIVVTFLAILELMKQNEIIIEQERNFGDLFIAAKHPAV
ncbi:segregation and condensation protein A [Geobacillus genomosp. 3]|uniref:Segregation and condensation protein A n=1 Tax=Geobacillus genomosp. 3 TaxID=1921421 RepID=S6A2W7_GEOG3|nr:segregation/condensation protein A [Geobacillus genomosp. 3]AGT32606.1 segregation and condensation protein A [Geobacillus genomosp. 3]